MPQDESKNTSEQEQPQISTKTVPYPYNVHQQFEDETINLYELFVKLWKNKWLVIIVTAVAFLGAIIYSLALPSVYKAEALIIQPKAKDFQEMNLIGLQKISNRESKFTQFDSEKVFNIFIQNLTSRTIHKKFIQKYNLIEFLAPDKTPGTRDEDIYNDFAQLINVEEKSDGKKILFSIELHDGKIAAKWVNDFIEFVDKETVALLVGDLKNLIENLIKENEYNIKSKRLMAEKRREDQIIRYSEHAEIAKKLGMLGRVDATNIIQTTEISRDITSATSPLYYLGYEALLTEIEILRNRKSDDPFILGLRDLQEQLAMLQSITLDEKNMSAVQIDQAAFPPKYAVKPNRRLIVSLAIVFGLFAGVFLVFFIEFFKGLPKKHSE